MKSNLINLGPQHPASHGVLRIILELQGEYIKNIDSQIGFLHRGTEKLAEYREYQKVLPYFDRLDYVSWINMEESYALAIESLLNIKNKNLNININRLILVELSRIQNHILAIATNAMDIGALSPFLWLFDIREDICVLFEKICGARMHVAFIKPGEKNFEITPSIMFEINSLIYKLDNKLKILIELLYSNKIWKSRTINVGILNRLTIERNSITGILARSSGLNRDLRLNQSYGSYNFLKPNVPTLKNGDINDRIHLRVEEIFCSLNIIKVWLKDNNNIRDGSNIFSKNNIKYTDKMENIIKHFKNVTWNKPLKLGKIYHWIESPKGEFGLILLNNKNIHSRLDRTRIRAPGFIHLQSLSQYSKNNLITDLLAILGSFDVVLGEIDR